MRQATKKRRTRAGLFLVFLSCIFAASVVLRLSSFDLNLVAVAEASDPAEASVNIGPTSPLRAALDEVEALRQSLMEREAAVADRESAVQAAQILVEARLAELESAEQRLSELIQISDQAAETDLERLTDVYQMMPPDQAADLFSQMDPSFAAGFLSRMGTEAGAAILAELDAEVAYAISVVIATRNAGAPTLSDTEGTLSDTES